LGKSYTGLTADTAKNLVLDSGAFFTNFIVGTDTFESAVTAGKLIGATRGGGSFSAVPEIRQIEADGAKGAVVGLQLIDTWEVKMSATVIEVSEANIERALGAFKSELDVATLYSEIRGTDKFVASEYIKDVTFVGKQSGYSDPIIIQIYNALNTNGLTLTTSDKGESAIEFDFQAHYAIDDLTTPPFAIFYPTIM